MFLKFRYITMIVFGLLVMLTLLIGIYFKHSFINHFLCEYASDQAHIIYSDIKQKVKQPLLNIDKKTYLHASNFGELLQISVTRNKKTIYTLDPTVKIIMRTHILPRFDYEQRNNKMLKRAQTGIISEFIINQAVIARYDQEYKKPLFIGYYPINIGEEQVMISIVYDLSKGVHKLETLQFTLVLIVILGFSMVVIGILIVAQKSEELLYKHQLLGEELSEAKSFAEAESKSKSQFLANISHELRTPLNAIIGFSEIIMSESLGEVENQQYKDFIRDINVSGNHLLKLINDILDFAKADEGNIMLSKQTLDLHKLISVSLKSKEHLMMKKQLTLNTHFYNTPIIIRIDGKRFKQAFINILLNAIKFTPEDGHITITTKQENNIVTIEIIDTGIGMNESEIIKSLSVFSQVDRGITKRYEGLGLGLSLSKKIIELLGGRLSIQSSTSSGTTVTIILPL